MKITKIETFVPTRPVDNARVDIFCWVQVHTDAGIVGLGESTGLPGIIAAAVHDLVAPFALGADPFDREHLWASLWAKAEFTGVGGAEVRAIAAVDIALWDIAGQALGVPLHQLLGGVSHERLPLYNTCLNGPVMLDQDRSTAEHVGDLARELIDQGYAAMKIWPFDPVSPRGRSHGGRPAAWPLGPIGHRLSNTELELGLAPVRAIRDAVGNGIDIAIEGHGRWNLPNAIRIARALEPYDVLWLEDIMPVDNADDLQRLAQATSVPLCISERLQTRWGFRPILKSGAASFVMFDIEYTGGITEAQTIAKIAETYRLPIVPHGAYGSVLSLANAHLFFAAPNAMLMEVVRSMHGSAYDRWVPNNLVIEHGWVRPPMAPGLGTALDAAIRGADGVAIRTSTLDA
jgi:L-alanine-DL-glutamate epimerase-like enolase superfamily enzyme